MVLYGRNPNNVLPMKRTKMDELILTKPNTVPHEYSEALNRASGAAVGDGLAAVPYH